MRLVPAFLALAALAAPAPAAETPAPATFTSRLQVGALLPLNAEGRPIGPAQIADVPEKARNAIAAALAALRFEPVRRDGVPVPSELPLRVMLTARGMGLATQYEVSGVRAGPVVADTPRYPVASLMEGQAALLMVRVECGVADDRPTRRIEVVASAFLATRQAARRDAFKAAAAAAFERSCAFVETIDGQPVSTVLHQPVRFFVNGRRIADDTLEPAVPVGEVPRTDGLERARLLPVEAGVAAPAG